MPLTFQTIYLLTNPSENFLKAKQVAFGVRRRPAVQGAPDVFQFLTNNPVWGGHSIEGKVLRDADGVVEVEDASQPGDDGKPVIWRFEPLTLKEWKSMAENIDGYDEIQHQFKTDEDVRAFYTREWLGAYDWWKEHPEEAST